MKHNLKYSLPLAIIVTLVAIIYQRATGPTYPKKIIIKLAETEVKVKFLRSQGGDINAPIEIPKLSPQMKGSLFYKRYPTNDQWTMVTLEDKGNRLYAELPNQPPAGKLQYYLELSHDQEVFHVASQTQPIMIRYKGEVPTVILAPHIFFMFFSMLLSALAGFEAYQKTDSFRTVGFLALGCLFFGGMCLGPLVQKYAFGVYWAGFPYDWDLTDNKLLLSVLAWGGAMSLNIKKARALPIIAASIILIIVYSIPHSMQGSEYDYKKGKVITDREK